MAAKSPSSSTSAERLSPKQGGVVQAAAPQAVSANPGVEGAVSDQQWLEQSQQAWAEGRAKEEELARSEMSGDRVMQLLNGEQLGEVSGPSLVVAQASTGGSDSDRRAAAAAKAEEDRKAALLLEEEDDDALWHWLIGGATLLGAIGLARASDDEVVEPQGPASELLVYSTESVGGSRSESGDVDTNTEAGPYTLVRVQSFASSDLAELDDGADTAAALYVEFSEDRTDLSVEVLADGDFSSARAQISTDSVFSGEILVAAAGEDARASLDMVLYSGAEAVTHSFDLTVKTERGADVASADALITISADGDAHFSGDVLVSTDAVSSDASATLRVSADAVDLEGNVDVIAGVRDSSAEFSVSICADSAWVWGDSTEVTDSNDADGITGYNLSNEAAEWMIAAAAQDNSADLQADLIAELSLSAEMNVTALTTWSSAETTVGIVMSAEEIDLQGSNVMSSTETSTDSASTMTMGEDYMRTVEAAQFSSMVAAGGASSEMSLDMYGDSIEADVNFLVSATGRNASADLEVDISVEDVSVSVDDYVRLGGGWSESDDSSMTSTETASGASGTVTVGEDSTATAADWAVSSSGNLTDACLDVDVSGATGSSFDIDLAANIAVQASGLSSADAFVRFSGDAGDLYDVGISGDALQSFRFDVTEFSREQDNASGEDITFTASVEYAALDWTADATLGGSAELEVIVEAEGRVDLLANLGATAATDSYAQVDINITAGEDITVTGAQSGDTLAHTSGYQSDLYNGYSSGEDTTTQVDAASWQAVASGEAAGADLDVFIGATLDVLESADVRMFVDLNVEASALDANADIDIDVYATDGAIIGGGLSITYSSIDTEPTNDDDQLLFTEVSTEYAANWLATASGVDSSADIELSVDADFIELRVDQVVTASGAGSYADSDIELDASDEIHVSGEVTSYFSSGDVTEDSLDTQNASWALVAEGVDSYAGFDFSADAESVDLDLDVIVTALGANSVASGDISVYASEDAFMGAQDGASITVTATGADSLAYMEVGLYGEDASSYSGDVTVLANGVSGLDADAVMEMNLDSGSSTDFEGTVRVSALGADNDATLVLTLDGSLDVDISGDIYVKAVEGVASVSVVASGDSTFSSFVSLDADEGGQVYMSIVADSLDADDIYIYTDNDGTVTLNLDVNHNDSWEDIDVYGDVGGVFNLILQDGFDVKVDLDDDVQSYGGQFNLIVETPINFEALSAGTVGVSIEIDGFDATGAVIDTIDFQGADFDGFYLDATSTLNVYAEEYLDLASFLSDAETVLDGTVDYFFGTNGTDGWLAVDGDGEGTDYLITLEGVTNLDWSAVLSTQGQYTETII